MVKFFHFLKYKRNTLSAALAKFNGGGDVRKFEPKCLTYAVVDKLIQKLRDMHRNHPEWFEVPKFAERFY